MGKTNGILQKGYRFSVPPKQTYLQSKSLDPLLTMRSKTNTTEGLWCLSAFMKSKYWAQFRYRRPSSRDCFRRVFSREPLGFHRRKREMLKPTSLWHFMTNLVEQKQRAKLLNQWSLHSANKIGQGKQWRWGERTPTTLICSLFIHLHPPQKKDSEKHN